MLYLLFLKSWHKINVMFVVVKFSFISLLGLYTVHGFCLSRIPSNDEYCLFVFDVEVHKNFGGLSFLRLQGQRISQASNQQEAGSEQSLPQWWMKISCIQVEAVVAGYLVGLPIIPQDGYRTFLQNVEEFLRTYPTKWCHVLGGTALHGDLCKGF